jgi:hypothetical protein
VYPSTIELPKLLILSSRSNFLLDLWGLKLGVSKNISTKLVVENTFELVEIMF